MSVITLTENHVGMADDAVKLRGVMKTSALNSCNVLRLHEINTERLLTP